MLEEVVRVSSADGVQALADGAVQGFAGARGDFAQEVFEFVPSHLDGIEVCFVEGGGDERHADHAGERHIDAGDGDMSVALIVYDGTISVGTARLTMLRDHPSIGHGMHDFDYIARYLSYAREGFEQVIVRLDRGVVIKSHRNRGVFGELVRAFESLARDKGAKVAVGALWGQ